MNTNFFKNEFIDVYKKYNMMQEVNVMNSKSIHESVLKDIENISNALGPVNLNSPDCI